MVCWERKEGKFWGFVTYSLTHHTHQRQTLPFSTVDACMWLFHTTSLLLCTHAGTSCTCIHALSLTQKHQQWWVESEALSFLTQKSLLLNIWWHCQLYCFLFSLSLSHTHTCAHTHQVYGKGWSAQINLPMHILKVTCKRIRVHAWIHPDTCILGINTAT